MVTKDEHFQAIKRPSLVPCLLQPEEEKAAQAAMTRALQVSDKNKLCDQLHQGKGISDEVAQAWIAVRETVALGREYRFGRNQLSYHYTKDKKYLQY